MALRVLLPSTLWLPSWGLHCAWTGLGTDPKKYTAKHTRPEPFLALPVCSYIRPEWEN
jgi:hypothetical protein